jgi:hypothetical protein
MLQLGQRSGLDDTDVPVQPEKQHTAKHAMDVHVPAAAAEVTWQSARAAAAAAATAIDRGQCCSCFCYAAANHLPVASRKSR